MFDRFTDRARKAMGLAWKESRRFKHDYIGTEHILLGIIREGCVAADVLCNLAVSMEDLAAAVEGRLEPGVTITTGQLPFTPRAKYVLELALEEARELGQNYIGTENLLLGLIREEEGIGAQALRDMNVSLKGAREEIAELLGADVREIEDPVDDSIGIEALEIQLAWLKRLHTEMQQRLEVLEERLQQAQAIADLKETNEELRTRVAELERRLKELGGET